MKPAPSRQKHTGFAIALAWPVTYCKQPGAWYDPLMRIMGFNRRFYYKAGHAAVVLVNKQGGDCHYYDFGRYHAPFAHARVRSAETDHELQIHTKAVFCEQNERMINLDEILDKLQQNESCHGSGTLFAAYTSIDFFAAKEKADMMQQGSPLPYGPFVLGGTNCSRFVRTVILAGKPAMRDRLALRFMLPVTPTPMSNVSVLQGVTHYAKPMSGGPVERPFLDKKDLKQTLPPPEKLAQIPETAVWLSGEGAGSWFDCRWVGPDMYAQRYAPDGTLECADVFSGKDVPLDVSVEGKVDFEIMHPSHCNAITLLYGNRKFVLHRNRHATIQEQWNTTSQTGLNSLAKISTVMP